MTVAVHTSIFCDKCSQHSAGISIAANKSAARWAKADAKGRGWKVGKNKDYCPSCRTEIEAALSLAIKRAKNSIK